MKLLQLAEPRNRDELFKKEATDAHYVRVIDEPTVAMDHEGNVVFALGTVDGGEELLRAVRRLNYIIDWRTDGMQSRACTFGVQPRIPVRRNYCSIAASARTHANEHRVLESWGTYAAELMREHAPGIYERQRAQVEGGVLEHWRMKNGVFTSGIVNCETALWYHRDRGNFPDAYSMMIVLSKGLGAHGRLVLPEFDLAVAFDGADWFLFNGARWLHGVTPIGIPVHGTDVAYRYSVVWYALRGCAQCGTPEEELNRIRVLSTQSERKRKKSNRVELLRSLLKHGSPRAKEKARAELRKLGEEL